MSTLQPIVWAHANLADINNATLTQAADGQLHLC